MSNNISTFNNEQLQTINEIVQAAVTQIETKGRLIQFLQGNRADLPILKVGQPAFCIDEFSFYLGSDDGNKRVVMEHELGSISVEDGTISFAKLDTTLQNRINSFITLNDIPIASSTKSGLMTSQMYDKLNSVEQGANKTIVVDSSSSISATDAVSARQVKTLKDEVEYIKNNGVPASLTPATETILGGIKVGSNLTVASDGTLSTPNATTSTVGVVRLNDTVASTSNTQAATANAVKQAYDKAVEAMNNSGGGTIANIYQDNVTTSSTGTAFGTGTKANGYRATTFGIFAEATGDDSTAFGYFTVANTAYSTAIGKHNKPLTGLVGGINDSSDIFVIGNGSTLTKSNAFRVTHNGSVYGLKAFNSSGADYAEYFEWQDSNPNNEDRVGYFVTLSGDKIEIANSNSDYIIGVISANPSVIGDSHQDQWQGMYIRDEWSRIQNEYVDVEYEELDSEGKTIIKTRQDYVPKLNPNYDNNEDYIGREARQEWDAVGMLGKLLVRDDGTCEVNGFAKVADGGIATKSDTGYRVIKRINENIVQIIFK